MPSPSLPNLVFVATGLAWIALGCATAAPTRPAASPLAHPVVEPSSPTPTPTKEPPKTVDPSPATSQRKVISLDDLNLSFELPNASWHLQPSKRGQNGASQVGAERDDVLDDEGNAVRPYCGIISEPEPEERDVVMYSLSWRTRVPFKVDSVFSHEDGTIQLKNAVGYRGHTSQNDEEHTLFVVHALHREHGVVVVCDTTKSVLPKVEDEIKAFLKAVRPTD